MICDHCNLPISGKEWDEPVVWNMEDICTFCHYDLHTNNPAPPPSGVRPLYTGMFDVDE